MLCRYAADVRVLFLLPGVLALLLLLTGCERIVFTWRQPSPAFVAGDIDQDQEISREEWEAAVGTNALTRAVLEFDWGDCDRNGRLTWQEYFGIKVRRQHCRTSPLESLAQQAGQESLRDEILTPIVSAKDLHLARQSLMRSRQRLITAKFHDNYSEQDPRPGEVYLYTLSCGDVEPLEVPEISRDFTQFSRLAVLGPGLHAAIRCRVSNGSNFTFTYLQLRLATSLAGQGALEFHGKTLWVPPRTHRDLWIFPEANRPVTGVSLVALRMKRD